MIVAITGATGLVGRRLMQAHIGRSDEVRALSRRLSGADVDGPGSTRWCLGDLTDPNVQIAEFLEGVDILYHCAGETRDRGRMRALHVEGTGRLLNAAEGRVRRWIQLSSVGAYGRQSEGVVTEQSALQPCGEYEVTKAAADQLVQAAHRRGTLPAVVLRPSIVFGPGMRNRSLFQLFGMVRRGMFFFLGRPGASANYVSVDETVRALLLCGQHPRAAGRVYNLSGYATIEEFVYWASDELGAPLPRMRIPAAPIRILAQTFGRLPGCPLTPSRVDALTTRVRYPSNRIEAELGYRPAVSLEEALRHLVRVYQKNAR